MLDLPMAAEKVGFKKRENGRRYKTLACEGFYGWDIQRNIIGSEEFIRDELERKRSN